jgi:hypothetical protein
MPGGPEPVSLPSSVVLRFLAAGAVLCCIGAIASAFASSVGMVAATAPVVDRERFFRQSMTYGGIVVAVVPAVVWLVLVVPGFG